MGRLHIVIIGALVAAVLAGVPARKPPVGGQPPARSGAAPVSGPGPRSGLPWSSGVNGDPVIDAASVDSFAAWRGRPADVAVTYTDRTSWAGLESGPAEPWLLDNFAGWRGRLVISQPFYPTGAGSLAACAAGAYRPHWQAFGRNLVARGRADTYVRLGWEMNGDWMPWSARNAAQYVGCFRAVASAIRATDPAVLIDWTVSAHSSRSCAGRSTNCYPGDAYVDVVGIDSYDLAPASGTPAQFATQAAAPDGLGWLYAFAQAHRKLFAVGEWGVVGTGTGAGGGDNATYVRAMAGWFRAHARGLAYEAYFDNCDPGNVQSDLYRGCSPNPHAAAAYRALYGQLAPARVR